MRYKASAGIDRNRNSIEVIARASIKSEMKPAVIPPRTPPMSNIVDSNPAVLCEICTPATAAMNTKFTIKIMKRYSGQRET